MTENGGTLINRRSYDGGNRCMGGRHSLGHKSRTS